MKKEYTLKEVLNMPKNTRLQIYPYDNLGTNVVVSEGVAGNKYLYYIEEDFIQDAVGISSWLLDKATFIVMDDLY